MKLNLVCLFVFFSANIFGQEKFEKGYYIDAAKKRVDGFIKVVDLEGLNAKGATLGFRNTPEGETGQIGLENVIEVGVDNDVKMQRHEIEIDDANLHQVKTAIKYPVYEKRKLFLNVLLEGKASLLSIDNGNGIKYFYSFDETPIQLIYKKYKESETRTAKENVTFRRQLAKDLSCEGDLFDKFSSVKYEKSALLTIFEQYNTCNGVTPVLLKNEKKSKSKIYFGAYGGAQLTSVTISGINPEPGKESEINYLLGGEMELRSSNEKWGLVVRAEVEMIDVSLKTVQAVSTDTYTVKNISLNWGFGGRFYFNPEAKNKLFGEIGCGFSVPTGKLEHEKRVHQVNQPVFTAFKEYSLDASVFGTAALGYTFSDRLGVEVKANMGRKLLSVSQSFATIKTSAVGVNLKYAFKK